MSMDPGCNSRATYLCAMYLSVMHQKCMEMCLVSERKLCLHL
jgi:hypothetical protein